MSTKTISIITPTYNQGNFIAKTIESILGQVGDFYIDYIIMDGGSTDQTVEVIEKYEKLLKQNCSTVKVGKLDYYVKPEAGFELHRCKGISFRWHSKKDKGQSDAINQGIALSEGEISTWLNSDDYYYHDRVLERVSQLFVSTDIDVVVGNTIALDAKGKELWRAIPMHPTLFSLLYIGQTPQQPAIFYRSELIKRLHGVDENLHYVMDVDLWARFLFAGAKFYKVEDFFAVQVYHDAAKSTQGDYWLQVFAPEDKMIKRKYRGMLGKKHYYYLLRKYIRLVLPAPVKHVLNKMISWLKKLIPKHN